MAKRIHKLTKKAPKSLKVADTDPEDSEDEEEEKEPVVKKAPKAPGFVETDPEKSGESDSEDTLRAMGFPQSHSLKKGYMEGKKISYVAKFDTNYL